MEAGRLELTRLTCAPGGGAGAVDVSFVAPEGGFVAVLGARGSGKSALMRTLGGFARADSGVITLDGAVLGATPPHRRGFGIVQQPDALFPALTLAQNVALPLRLRRVRRRDRARLVEAVLDLVQLSAGAALRPAQATQSECRLALLARAAVFGPRLLLLDDPFGALDEAGAIVMTAAIRRAHATLGATVVMATSRAAQAMALADTIAVLDRGRLVQLAAPEALAERPLTAGAASLLGEVNLLPGTVLGCEDDDIATVRLACGPLAEGRLATPLRVGANCILAISPARIALAPVRAADMGDRALDAAVIESVFLGDAFRVRVLLGSGTELVVRRPAAAGGRWLAAGHAVALAWQAHHAPIFAAEPSSLPNRGDAAPRASLPRRRARL